MLRHMKTGRFCSQYGIQHVFRRYFGSYKTVEIEKIENVMSGKTKEMLKGVNENWHKHFQNNIAILKLNSAPVNALDLEFATELKQAIQDVENDSTYNGLIITSNRPAFSAGLQITEVVDPDPERLKAFWSSIQQMWLTLYSSRLTTIAAINGAAPAGGCLIALGCDYRVMANNDKYIIGLNETGLGLVAPEFFQRVFSKTIGYRNAEKSLMLGQLFSPTEALRIGLVDEILDKEDVLRRSLEVCQNFLKKTDFFSRSKTKQLMRGEDVDFLKNNLDEDFNEFEKVVTSEVTQAIVKHYLQSLKK